MPVPGGSGKAPKVLSQEDLLLKQAADYTVGAIKGMKGYGNLGCVIKTREGVLLLGGRHTRGEGDQRRALSSDSLQNVVPQLAGVTKQTIKPQVGDVIALDRKAGANSSKDGHLGIFLGYDSAGRIKMSGNKPGSVYTVDAGYGALQARPYDNGRGVWAYENPSSPVRRTMGQIGTLGDTDPLVKAFEAARDEVDKARRKLALYSEGVEAGTISMAQAGRGAKGGPQTRRPSCTSSLRTSLSNEDFARLQQAQPEFIADLFKAWNDSQGEEQLKALAESVKTAKEKFDELSAVVEGLRGALRGLEDSYAGLRSSRAKAQGHGLEALAIDADTSLRQVYRGIEDVERFRADNAQKLAEQDAQTVAQETQMVAQLASVMKSGYDLVSSLKGTEGAEGLSADLMAALEPLYQQWAPELDAQQATAGDVLQAAGYQLQTAASALQAAASALQGAASALQGSAAAAAAQAGANAATAIAAAAQSGVASGSTLPGGVSLVNGAPFIPSSVDASYSGYQGGGGGGGYWSTDSAGSDGTQRIVPGSCASGSCQYEYWHPGGGGRRVRLGLVVQSDRRRARVQNAEL